MPHEKVIGVIGGSGLYDIEGLTSVEHVTVDTPFGAPSDEYVVGRISDTEAHVEDGAAVRLVFLPRHGRGHKILPHEINYRANIHGMKQLGVEWIISVSAVGSMRPEIAPGDLVIVDQFYDRTKRRVSSFFGEGAAGHVSFADPVCPVLASRLYEAGVLATAHAGHGARVHRGGTYLVIDGPQFSTRAESRIYRSWGIDVIGMTNLPEAKLAREAEICYATVALSTDYDCWHESEEAVTVDAVVAVMKKNVAVARDLILRATAALSGGGPRTCLCKDASRHALMTDSSAVSAETRKRLQLILGAP